MAISRDKKNELVAEFTELLTNAKTTAFATYQGLSVAQLQVLRAQARENGVIIKVVKNRLVRVVLTGIDAYKDVDSSSLTGQSWIASSTTNRSGCTALARMFPLAGSSPRPSGKSVALSLSVL